MTYSILYKLGAAALFSILSATAIHAESSSLKETTIESYAIKQISSKEKESESKDAKSISTVSDLKGLDPTQSYYKIHDFILNAQSYDQIKPFLTKKALDSSFPVTESRSRVSLDFRQEQMFKLVKAILSSRVKITSEIIDGEKAVLKGVSMNKSVMEQEFDSLAKTMADSGGKVTVSKSSSSESSGNITGNIVMKIEDGVWKLDRENWKTKLEPTGKRSKAKTEIHIWCEDSSDVKFSNKPATGKLFGKLFSANTAEYSQTVNTLQLLGPGGDRWSRPSITLFLFNKGKLPLGQTFQTARRDLFGAPHVHVRYSKENKISRKVFTGSHHYGLKLRFNENLSDGMLTGHIVLRLPEASRSEINGYFKAKLK